MTQLGEEVGENGVFMVRSAVLRRDDTGKLSSNSVADRAACV